MPDDTQERIHVGETPDGEPVYLPTVDVLTGRGFLTGKSGVGKSNSVSVVIEELLDDGFPVLIVDAEGEYYGLKEEYELLHAGADEECDVQVSSEHAEKLATIALEENVPIILDVSGFLDEEESDALVRETARHLFAKEKKLKKPFLIVVEECHEYLPEGGGMDETGRMLIKVSKRGRKHGLGVVGISQRPADVKKDFITQANWLVWHRLTWENDTKVVRRIVGPEYGEEISDLDDGEAFVQLDWAEADVERIQFKRKRTFDAGATPGLDDVERPDLKSVSDSLTEDLSEITAEQQARENRVAELESELERKDERIAELKDELEQARDVSAAARKMANALAHGRQHADDAAGGPDADGDGPGYQSRLRSKNEEIARLEDRVAELEGVVRDLAEAGAIDADGADAADASTAEIVAETAEVRAETAHARTGDGAGAGGTAGAGGSADSTGPTGDGADEPSGDDADDPTGDDADTDDSPGMTPVSASDRSNDDGATVRTEDDAVGESGDDTPSDGAVDDADGDAGDEAGSPAETATENGAGAEAGGADDRAASVEEAAEAIGYERREWPSPDGAGDGADVDLADVDPRGGDEPLEADRVGLPEGGVEVERAEDRDNVERMLDELRRKGEQLRAAEDAVDADPDYPEANAEELLELADDPAVVVRVNAARRESTCNEDDAWAIVARLAADGPLTAHGVADRTRVSNEAAHGFLTELRSRGLVERDGDRRYALDAGRLRELADRDDRTARLGELRKQWEID